MPSGNVHTITTLVIATAFGMTAFQQQPLEKVVPLVGGALAGLVLTPDLDLQTGSISNRFVQKFGGCLLGSLWFWFWQPYARLVHHRSLLSHAPFIGTALRLLYLFGLPYLALLLVGQAGIIHLAFPAWLPWAVAGLVCADIAHWGLDNAFKN